MAATIVAVNLTASPIVLSGLGGTVPASSTLNLSDTNKFFEIAADPGLLTELVAGNLRLNVNGSALTSSQSVAILAPEDNVLGIKDNFLATTAPVIGNDQTQGYSVGSRWINSSTGLTYICTSAATGAAVWVQQFSSNGVDPGAHASRHLPAGSDPLTTATAVTITDSTNGVGTANSLARSDHTHAHGDRGGGTLHAVATTSVAGFMSSTDKTKLDSLGASVASSVITSTPAATTSATFQDAFPAQNITLTNAGDYLIMFDTNVSSSSAAGVPEIAIRVNGVIVTDSQRFVQGNGGANVSGFTHTIRTGLLVGAVITGVFRKSSGSGTTTVNNRRFTVIRVNQ